MIFTLSTKILSCCLSLEGHRKSLPSRCPEAVREVGNTANNHYHAPPPKKRKPTEKLGAVCRSKSTLKDPCGTLVPEGHFQASCAMFSPVGSRHGTVKSELRMTMLDSSSQKIIARAELKIKQNAIFNN